MDSTTWRYSLTGSCAIEISTTALSMSGTQPVNFNVLLQLSKFGYIYGRYIRSSQEMGISDSSTCLN